MNNNYVYFIFGKQKASRKVTIILIVTSKILYA